MPTNRTRKGRGAKLDLEILALLGMGTGMNSIPDEEIARLWKEHGKAVQEYFDARGWGEPFLKDFGVEPVKPKKKR